MLISANDYLFFPMFTDGVVLVDPEYFNKEGKKDRKG
jgi:hypothetical protein